MKNKLIMMASIVIGIAGAFGAGFAIGSNQKEFTPTQQSYITGVAEGGRFSVDAPTAHDNCIKEFYPDLPIALAGCLEVVDEVQQWKIP